MTDCLLIGSGGREHALAEALLASPGIGQLYVAPGNAGTAVCAKNIPISENDFPALSAFIREHHIGLVLVGPEIPLINGFVDYLRKIHGPDLIIVGPAANGARLEGSKAFSKKLMLDHGIPTAPYREFAEGEASDAKAFLRSLSPPYVIKADGPAAGNGVVICDSLEEAKTELKAMLQDAKFGEASASVVIEQFLKGIELSVFVLTDGESYKILPEAKDYKRIGEGDTGLNTGGMGAISPVPFADKSFMDKVENQIIIPTIKGIKSENIQYKGFVFFGLIAVKGEPFVIEYNCRMGDPETEVVMPRLKSDILDLFEGVASNTLSERDIQFDDRAVATVMMVSGGYPEDYEKGKTIYGLNGIEKSLVFHAGTSADGPTVVSAGGRVLAVSSYGKTIELALSKSYDSIEQIQFENAYYRKDIGLDLLHYVK